MIARRLEDLVRSTALVIEFGFVGGPSGERSHRSGPITNNIASHRQI